MLTKGKDISTSEVVQVGPAKVKLQTGKRIAYYSKMTLDRRDRDDII